MNPPRLPYSEELDAIAHASAATLADFIDVRETLNGACVAMFEHYVSDCPGYTGRVAVVVWPGGPELFDVYTFDKNGEAKAAPHDSAKTRAAPAANPTYGERVRELEAEGCTTSDAQGIADAEQMKGRKFRFDPSAPLDTLPAGGSTDPFSPHYRGSDFS